MKICRTCNIQKPYTSFHKNKRKKDGHEINCKDCRYIYRREKLHITKEYNRLYKIKHRERLIVLQKNYYTANKEKFIKSVIEYQKKRLKEDFMFKLMANVRGRIRKLIIKNDWIRRKPTIEILGADLDTVRLHIESQFEDWMTWENYGLYTWHIDHIIPLSSAKTEEELFKLCHYTNLQPLSAKDNLSKSKKIISPQPPLLP